MAVCQAAGVRIRGIACAVPEPVSTESDLAFRFGETESQKLCESIGVQSRHIAPANVCSSDLCYAAAERLLSELGWERESVRTLIFVSQTPDYVLPATSCVLQSRLGLSKDCAAFDINLGCSGYVYGLWVASQLLMAAPTGRTLLLVGDTVSKVVAPHDRATVALFGDAGSATALERDPQAEPMTFCMGTDGAGREHIIVRSGGFRERASDIKDRALPNDESAQNSEYLSLNGAEVFAFTLREVPAMIERALSLADWSLESTDAVVMHQANSFMLRHLAKRLSLPDDKLVLALGDFGNTSSASIPLAIVHALRSKLNQRPMRLVLAGFGVGMSWATATVTCKSLVLPELIQVSCECLSTAEPRSKV